MARLVNSMFSFCLSSIIAISCLSFAARVYSITLGSDTSALRGLQRAIDPNSIPSSSFLSTWNFSVDPCESSGGQFLGILCTIPTDNSSSRVTSIDLDRAGYDGFLGPEIGNLTELTFLDLSNNRFRGPIPETISNLRKLTSLTLSENAFTGAIPTAVANLRMLEFIDLSQNRLSGSIPSFISGFRSLTNLRLSNNGFSGAIPDLTGLWQLSTLDFSTNQLYGGLPKLPKSLKRLFLNQNILSGRVSSLRKLNQLQELDLSDNRFSGSIGGEVLTLPDVGYINVSQNRFNAMRVARFRGASQLRVLDAHRNSLQGHLPQNLVSADNLTSINLAHNQFSGAIPREYWAKLRESWTRLYLDHNFLVGSLPSGFGSNGTSRLRGSLAGNCLRCPSNVQLCHGGQRPDSECVRRT